MRKKTLTGSLLELGMNLLGDIIHEAREQQKAAEQEKKHEKLSEGSIDVEFKVKEK